MLVGPQRKHAAMWHKNLNKLDNSKKFSILKRGIGIRSGNKLEIKNKLKIKLKVFTII